MEPLSPTECYHILRGQVEHEDSLTTQRLSWLLAAQSFLFSAYAIVLNGPNEPASHFIAAQRGWLLTAIPALGLSSAALIYVSILSGVAALLSLRQQSRALCGSTWESGSYPTLQRPLLIRLGGLTAPLLGPPIFVGAWFFLMLRGLAR